MHNLLQRFGLNLLLLAATALFGFVNIAPISAVIQSVVGVPFLLVIPGYIMARIILKREANESFWQSLLFSVGLSVLYLMVVGLFINTLLPYLGNAHPLAQAPLLISIVISTLLLQFALLLKRGPLSLSARTPKFTTPQWLLIGWGSALPILAIGGATTLNNNGSNVLTMLSLAGIAIYLIAFTALRKRTGSPIFAFGLYAMSLTLLLATSMRGWGITGHDVTQEFQVFQLTLTHSHWDMTYFRDPYNACLSITILPTILARLTGIADVYIYKLLFQLVFALTGPAIYLLLKDFVEEKAALLAAFMFITFPTFMTDMSMLDRQEMAIFFLALFSLVAFKVNLPRRPQAGLLILLGLGMILSHYSTTYVALGVLLGAKILETARVFWYQSRGRDLPGGEAQIAIRWPLILLLVVAASFWNGQLTDTSQSISKTIGAAVVSLPKVIERAASPGGSSYGLFSHKASDQELYQAYLNGSKKAQSHQTNSYYPAQVTAANPVGLQPETVLPLTSLGKSLDGFGIKLTSLFDLLRGGYAKLMQVSIIAGLVLLTASKKMRKDIPLPFLLLGCSSIGLMALQILLPAGVINYGLLRFFQQSLIFIALPAVIFFFTIARWLRIPARWRPIVIGTGLAGFFIVLSGFAPQLSGGFQPTLALNNQGFYYEAYEVQPDELASYAWLKKALPHGTVIQSDEFTRRQMRTYAGLYGEDVLLPDEIIQGSYVYLGDANTRFNDVPFYDPYGGSGALLHHSSPTQFLNATKSLVYSGGSVQIYR